MQPRVSNLPILRRLLPAAREEFVRGHWISAITRNLVEEPGSIATTLHPIPLNHLSGMLDDIGWLTPRERRIAIAIMVLGATVHQHDGLSVGCTPEIVDWAVAALNSEWGSDQERGAAPSELDGEERTGVASSAAGMCSATEHLLNVLRGHSPTSEKIISMPVVLVNSLGGYVARLQLEMFPSDVHCIAPDVTTMAFVKTDKEFRDSLQIAWQFAARRELVETGFAVRWKLLARSGRDVELSDVNGPSLGAAVAVGLRCLGEGSSSGVLQDWVVTGAVDLDGQLKSVAEYEEKMMAAYDASLAIVLPTADVASVRRQSLRSTTARLEGAANVDDAYEVVLSRRNTFVQIGDFLSDLTLSRRKLIAAGAAVTASLAGVTGGRNVLSSRALSAARHLDAITRQHERWYWEIDAAHLQDQVSAHVAATLEKICDASGASQEIMISVAARGALLAGRIEFFDLRRPAVARSHFGLALSLAESTDNSDLRAVVLGHYSFIPGWEGDEHAINLLRRAHEEARHASSTTRAWLCAVEGELLGYLPGTGEMPLRALDRGEQILSGTNLDCPEWIDFFDPTRLEGFRARALLDSGHPREARTLLFGVRRDLPESAEKQVIVTLADEALAAMRSGDIEDSINHLTSAKEILIHNNYQMGHERVDSTLAEFDTIDTAASGAIRERFRSEHPSA